MNMILEHMCDISKTVDSAFTRGGGLYSELFSMMVEFSGRDSTSVLAGETATRHGHT